MLYGYVGKLLWVDLSDRRFWEESLDETTARRYLGGYGLGARILFDRQAAGVDSLGPENTLGFLSGLFTGTDALGGSRFAVVGRSPLTGTWGDANSGGRFGPVLRFAGYDAVFFVGASADPVYLAVVDGVAQLCDAGGLWGKDTHETEELLKATYGKDAEIACIGPAGERLALIAAIMTDRGRAAARSGLGAVMGAKKLKAIVVKGSAKVPAFASEVAAELRRTYVKKLGGLREEFRRFGTASVIVPFARIGDTPVKNWTGVCDIDFPTIEKIGVDEVMARVHRKYACHRCPIACGGIMRGNDGEHPYPYGTHKPEYETVSMFGTNCLNDDVDSIIEANDICNRFGVDTISAGATMAFAIECYEKGVFTKADTGGVELTWGNHRSIVTMLRKTVTREGFGDVLADGVRVAATRIGGTAGQFAVHISGQEPPAHNPKLEYGFASCYRMDATPARHMRWHAGFMPPGIPYPPYEPGAWSGRGQAQKTNVVFNHACESLGACMFVIATYPHVDAMLAFVNALSGWEVDLEELLRTGERIANLRQAFNIREGINSLEYVVSGRLEGRPPLETGPLAGVTVDQNLVNREFLEAMDWDRVTTRPSDRKLLELGLDDVLEALGPTDEDLRGRLP